MKILFVGLGGIGQRHVRNLRHLLGSDVDIIAYRTRRQTHVITPELNADSNRNVEMEYSIQVSLDLNEALSQNPTIAFICNPSNLHVSVAEACIERGCDIFVEKPLSDSMDGLVKLVRNAADLKRVAMVGYQLRFHPCLKKIAEVVQSGSLGNLLAIRATVGEDLTRWHPYEDYRNMYASSGNLGGGVVLSQIHEIDYLYSLFGLPEQVFAVGGHWSDLEIDVEDTASILMTFRVGNRSLPVHLHQDYLQWPPNRQCELIGDRGKAVMDLRTPSVTIFKRDNDTPEIHTFPDFERNQLFLDEMRHFLDCVRTRRKPVVDLKDGLQSLKMALAAKQSMQTHMPVDMEDFDLGTL
jgi:predicted dehydrogenase